MSLKISILILTLMGIILPSYAHPGVLDEKGGHNCWNSCEQWGLHQGEYHIHNEPNQYHEKGALD